ncbi:hypothetical protein ACVXZ4_08445 [Lacisediminihabitans sp. FW035]
MTSLLLDRLELEPDYALQEAVPDLLVWESLTSGGRCTWFEADRKVTLIGVDPAFTFLTLNLDQPAETSTRFCQMTGGMHGGLLIEIGGGAGVGIVAPCDAGRGRRVTVTESSPWEYSTADELVLLPRDAVMPIACDWLIHGDLSPKYRLRPVEGYPMPAVSR